MVQITSCTNQVQAWIIKVTASRRSDASKLKELMKNVYANLRLIAACSRAHQPKKIVLKSDQNIHSQPSRKKEAKNLDNGKETHIINLVFLKK